MAQASFLSADRADDGTEAEPQMRGRDVLYRGEDGSQDGVGWEVPVKLALAAQISTLQCTGVSKAEQYVTVCSEQRTEGNRKHSSEALCYPACAKQGESVWGGGGVGGAPVGAFKGQNTGIVSQPKLLART